MTMARISSVRLAIATLVCAASTLAFIPAVASTLVLNYNSEFSGAQAPAGPPTWLTAVFDDFGGTGSVRLTMSTSGLLNSENVKEWYFNINPALNPASLVFTYNAGLSTAAAATGITKSTDCCKADGDGKYDFQFSFTPSTGFPALKTVVYDITLASITAASFNFMSTAAGGNGPFLSAAHVQNTTGAGSGGSGWVAGTVGVIPGAGSGVALRLRAGGTGLGCVGGADIAADADRTD